MRERQHTTQLNDLKLYVLKGVKQYFCDCRVCTKQNKSINCVGIIHKIADSKLVSIHRKTNKQCPIYMYSSQMPNLQPHYQIACEDLGGFQANIAILTYQRYDKMQQVQNIHSFYDKCIVENSHLDVKTQHYSLLDSQNLEQDMQKMQLRLFSKVKTQFLEYLKQNCASENQCKSNLNDVVNNILEQQNRSDIMRLEQHNQRDHQFGVQRLQRWCAIQVDQLLLDQKVDRLQQQKEALKSQNQVQQKNYNVEIKKQMQNIQNRVAKLDEQYNLEQFDIDMQPNYQNQIQLHNHLLQIQALQANRMNSAIGEQSPQSYEIRKSH